MANISEFFCGLWRFILYIITCKCVPEDIRSCKDTKKETVNVSGKDEKVQDAHPADLNISVKRSDSLCSGSVYNGSSSGYETNSKINSPPGYYLESVSVPNQNNLERNQSETIESSVETISKDEHFYCTCDELYDEPIEMRYENEAVHKMMLQQQTNTKITIPCANECNSEENEEDDFDEGIEEVNNNNNTHKHRYVNEGVISNRNGKGYRRDDVQEGYDPRVNENIYGEYKARFGAHASSFKSVCIEMKGLRSNTTGWTPSEIRRTSSRAGY